MKELRQIRDAVICALRDGGLAAEAAFPARWAAERKSALASVSVGAAEGRAAGVDTFLTPEKKVLPDLFGGLQNWFFTGPSGEQIELLQML